jgi:synaptobrevin family protein YKT6
MVQIFSLTVLIQQQQTSKPIILSRHIVNQSWFSYLYQDTIHEFISFFSRFLCERTETSCRQSIEKDGYIGYVHKRSDGLCVVCITDLDYPERVACDLLRKVLYDFDDYLKKNSISLKKKNDTLKDDCISNYNSALKDVVTQFQDPTKVDQLLRLKKDVEQTTEVMKQTLNKLLKRGEIFEDLIRDTEELSEQSKEFYRHARRSKCASCSIL